MTNDREERFLRTLMFNVADSPAYILETITWWEAYSACHAVLFVKPNPDVFNRSLRLSSAIPHQNREPAQPYVA